MTHTYQTQQRESTQHRLTMGRDPTSLAGKVTRFLASRCQDNLDQFVYAPSDTSVESDVVDFEFLDYGDQMDQLGQSSSSDDQSHHPNNQMDLDDYEGDEEEKDQTDTLEENRSFWDNQHQLLQANIYRTSSLESRIRNATKEALQDIQNVCGCSSRRPMGATTTCRNCLRREVSRRLQKAGFNSAICKTKWRTSQNIPSGEHTFLDVIDNTSTKKGEIRVMIELNFRAEFEMARGSNEYNQLVQKLPEVFVGKVERLSNIIKILCMAAKKCMKEKRMHMGPWRKHRYMQAKWLGPCERNTSTTPLSMGGSYSERLIKSKPKASMLTIDLLDKLPNMHYTAVEVV